jgi:hypothetical protein
MSELEAAAREYIAARYELRGAATAAILDGIGRVDWAWHELTVAAGDHDPECCGCDAEIPRPRT